MAHAHHHHHLFGHHHSSEDSPAATMTGLRSAQVLESKQYAVLTKWLSGHCKSVGEALDSFCGPVEDKYMSTQSSKNAEGLLWTLWQAILAAAAGIDHKSPQRQQLADLVVNLTFRPTLSKGDATCKIDEMTVWRDLPVLGWQLREAWNLAAAASSDQTSKEQWVNTNAFTATLASGLHTKAQDRPDYSLFGLWTLRTALEEQGDIPDVSVAAAAVWLIYGAPTIRAYCKQNKTFEGKVAKPGSSFAQEEWRGFTELRWEAWRNNLKDVETAVSNQPAANLVEEAVKAMEETEK